jgi:anti-sigma factor RsiW
MHGFIRDHLEDVLAGKPSAQLPAHRMEEIEKHLKSCAECSNEFAAMRAQSALLRTLRAPEEHPEPRAGFYARVVQRIEERTKDSIWSVFIDSPFGKRLAYTSLAIAALLGSYVVTLEARDGHLGGHETVAQQMNSDADCYGNQTQQRNAVLVNFASTEGPSQ